MPIRTLKNVTINWCKFSAVDDYGKYSCQVNLNAAQVKEVKAWGLKPRESEGSYFLRVRRDADRGPVVVKDAQLNVVTANIANGATANVMLDVYEYKKFGGGISCRLEKVQVLTWDVYGEDADFEAVDVEGGSQSGEDELGGDEGERLF